METAILHTDLVSIVWTLAGGFCTIIIAIVGASFWLGKKVAGYTQLKAEVAQLGLDLKTHDNECKEVREADREHNDKVEARLAEGATKFALLEAGQKRIDEGLRRIEDKIDRRRS